MDAALLIRNAVAGVNSLREVAQEQPTLGRAISCVKRFQRDRFARTYDDLAQDARFADATRFFLTELYGDADFSERDRQFCRVAGAVQRLLPVAAVDTAVALAQLHGLSEQLDYAMGSAWLQADVADDASPSLRYVRAWRTTGNHSLRVEQLRMVLAIGSELDELTRMPGLRFMLRAMRGPASAAGLSSLQKFLEAGFDAFSELGKSDPGADRFLGHIRRREGRLMDALFAGPLDAGCALLDYRSQYGDSTPQGW